MGEATGVPGSSQGFGLVPLEGGHSGETFLADAGGERTVVRLYVGRGAGRGPEAVAVDAAVLRLVHGLLPVPEVLEVRRPRPGVDAPAVLVTGHLPGRRLDLVLPELDDVGLRTLGRNLGVVVARLATMPLPRAGAFVDDTLRVEPWPAGDLGELVASKRGSTALSRWPVGQFDALVAVADRAQGLLDEVARSTLVHGDLNAKNLLVDPVTLEVTGVLDWEFAHAGPPVADLGNLLRFDRRPALVEAVVATYRERVPDAGGDVLGRARAADLPALVDLAARRGENPVTEQAHHLLGAVARSGDLHAVPQAGAGWTGV